MKVPLVNHYLAHKQHLLPSSRLTDVVQVTRDVVALHATDPTTPYLSLWARSQNFQRQALDNALYERRELVRLLCMRVTLHVVPSDQATFFFQAYAERRTSTELRDGASLLVQAGLCKERAAGKRLNKLHQQVLDVLTRQGPGTVREIGQAVPELQAKIQHSVGKSYEGEFSIGSRLISSMCALGMLVRTRPSGTWRSNLYEYAALADWLPDVNLDSVSLEQARTWLVRRYLSAFGPATLDDVVWWTGLTKGETKKALQSLEPMIEKTSIEGLDGEYLILTDDIQRPQGLLNAHPVFLLPALDPYIMGYHDRRRFLSPEHSDKVFDRAGNAMPTVWVNGRVVGAWGQRQDGSVVYGLFESVSKKEQSLLTSEARRLESFLDGEYLAPRTQTPFTRALGHD